MIIDPTVYAVDTYGHVVALSRTSGNAAAKSKGESLKPGWRLATADEIAGRKPKPIAKSDPIKIESK